MIKLAPLSLRRRIAFQVQFGPYAKLAWVRACKLGQWRCAVKFPWKTRRMMAFERRKETLTTHNYYASLFHCDPGERYR